jgi:hypothetical protein
MREEAGAEFRICLKIFNKKCKKPDRNDLQIFLVALYGSEYYCEDFIRSSLFKILLKNRCRWWKASCWSGGGGDLHLKA